MPRRTRSPHRGVILIPPKGEHATWRARCDDPDTGGKVWVRLDPLALRSADARRAWAVKRSEAIAKRRMDLASGAPLATRTGLTDAVDTFFRDRPHLRASTVALYRQHAKAFLAWAAREGIATGDDLTRERLKAFATSRARVKRRASVEGGKKGEKTASAQVRAPGAVNVELRAVRAVLSHLREHGLLSRISTDDLRDSLKRLETSPERLEYLKPAELRRLLEAAIAHDAAKYKATREEHAKNAPGETPRFKPVAPFVVTMLLSGMRLDEGLSLEWPQVDLDATDHDGRKVGDIQLTTRTKTKKPREIALEVSPGLRALLAAMRPKPATGSVFGLSRGEARAAERRLSRFGAPEFSWQALRQSAGTYLSNAPGIFGAAAAFHSARQLGHSVQVAERHYVGRARGIPREAKTLEAAMGVVDLVDAVTARVQ